MTTPETSQPRQNGGSPRIVATPSPHPRLEVDRVDAGGVDPDLDLGRDRLAAAGASSIASTSGPAELVLDHRSHRPIIGAVESAPTSRPPEAAKLGRGAASFAGMKRINIAAPDFEYDADDPEGFRAGMARLGKLLGAERTGISVYELPPGQSICPYHYEVGEEEWLLVLAGNPTVRHPEGSDGSTPGTSSSSRAAPRAPTGSQRRPRRPPAC